MSEKYPSETADRFLVRFPPGMRDRIAVEAKKNSRSMNAEIVARLESSFASGSATFDERLQRLELDLEVVRRQLKR